MNLWKRRGYYYDKENPGGDNEKPDRRKLIVGDFGCREFESINKWQIDEKIDGTNIQIMWNPNDPLAPRFGGRTDNAQIPTKLFQYLKETFTREKLLEHFSEPGTIVFFGEGYGAKIQKCGSRYRNDQSFILFDVVIDDIWLEKANVIEIAQKMGIAHTVNQMILTTNEVVEFVKSKPISCVSVDKTLVIEGVIARSWPLMRFRVDDKPIMFKLKCEDLEKNLESA